MTAPARTLIERQEHLVRLLGSARTVGDVWRINAGLADLDEDLADAERPPPCQFEPPVRERRSAPIDPAELERLRAEHRVMLPPDTRGVEP